MRTLVIRFSALGDLLLTLPALRDLSAASHKLHFLTLSRFAPLMEPLPGIERVWSLDPSLGVAGLRAMAAELAEEKFDAVLDLHDNLRSRSLHVLLAVRGPRWITTHRDALRRRILVAAPDTLKASLRKRPFTPVYERHREAAAQLSESGHAPEQAYPLDEVLQHSVDEELAALGLDPNSHPLALAPGAAWIQKAWPRFEEFAAALPAHLPLLVVGGPGEEELCRAVAATAGERAKVFAGALALPRLAATLSRCRGLVGGDSGLAHLAEAVDRPVCTLFGPTVPEFGFAPRRPESLLIQRNLSCRPCSLHGKRPCKYGDQRCLAELEPESVIAELREGGWLE
ncbi:glycosyltransferase family 9 protein [bacterium]|nr:glycosyltransferase family 9 protein [bacterium]